MACYVTGILSLFKNILHKNCLQTPKEYLKLNLFNFSRKLFHKISFYICIYSDYSDLKNISQGSVGTQ